MPAEDSSSSDTPERLRVWLERGDSGYWLRDAATGEALRWKVGLGRLPHEAKAFYGLIAVSTLIGIFINFVHIDPIKALYWSAVLNGIVAAPLMVVMMFMSINKRIMGNFTLPWPLQVIGWIATIVMTFTAVALIVTWVA